MADSIDTETYFTKLDFGLYELVNASAEYFPEKYGVLLHFKASIYYGSMIIIGVHGAIYARSYSPINDSWYEPWRKMVLTSDLGYTDVTMDTVRGSNNYVPNITGMNYIPVVLRVSSDYTGVSVYGNRGANSWLVISPTEQNMTIRFYKYPA